MTLSLGLRHGGRVAVGASDAVVVRLGRRAVNVDVGWTVGDIVAGAAGSNSGGAALATAL